MGLFGKSSPRPKTVPVTREPSARPAEAMPTSAETVIGPETEIRGELASSENMRIEGRVEGKIRARKHLVIGERGRVQAEIEAEVVSIRGRLDGDCTASQKVEVTGTGKVFGNINAPVIAVAEGAVFRGASRMTVRTSPGTTPAAAGPPPARPERPAPDEPTPS